MKKGEIGEAYSRNVRGEKFMQSFWYKLLKDRDQLENMGVDGRIILKRMYKIRWEYLDWIHLGWEPETGCCEDGNERSCSVEYSELLA
jgi:hypothetical protein